MTAEPRRSWTAMKPSDFGHDQQDSQDALFPMPDGFGTRDLFEAATEDDSDDQR